MRAGPIRVLTCCCALLGLCALTACTGRASQQTLLPAGQTAPAVSVEQDLPAAFGAEGLTSLPAPSTLVQGAPAGRSTSYVPADLHREGEDFEPSLAHANVSTSATAAELTPDWQPGGPLADMAFAIYRFDIPGYDLNSMLQLGWETEPAETSELWLGLAHWDSDRWRWFNAASDPAVVRPSSISEFFTAEGQLMAVVLIAGASDCALDYLRVGTQLPVPVLDVTSPSFAFGSLDATFDASASSDPDGSITKFEWDFDGDGTFDEDTGTETTAGNFYNDPGSYPVTLRVTDNFGVQATTSATVSVATGWSSTVGGPGREEVYDVVVAPDGTIWACGLAQGSGEGPVNEIMLLRYSAAGELLLEQYWSQGTVSVSQYGVDIEIMQDGSVCLLGHAFGLELNGNLLQRYDPLTGELELCRVLPFSHGTYRSMMPFNNQLCLCGTYGLPGPDSQQTAAYAVVDAEFNGNTGEHIDFPSSFSHSIFVQSLIFEVPSEIEFCGAAGTPGPFVNPKALVATLPLDGSTGEMWVLIASSQELSHGERLVRLGSGLSQRTCVVVSNIPEAGGPLIALSELTGSPGTGYSFGGSIDFGGFARGAGANNLLVKMPGPGTGVLRIDSNLALQSSYGFDGSGPNTSKCAVAYDAEGLVVCGFAEQAAGQFGSTESPASGEIPGSWTKSSPTFVPFSFETLGVSLENTSTHEPGVQNSGGGGDDAWVTLHQPGAL